MSNEQQEPSVKNEAGSEAKTGAHELEITYKVDGEVVKVIRRQIDEKYHWFLLGNMSWREW